MFHFQNFVDNILVETTSEDCNDQQLEFIVLADFGQALRLREKDNWILPNRGANAHGAPICRPPEAENEDVDYRKFDLFGMGLVMHHMMSGEQQELCSLLKSNGDDQTISVPDGYDHDIQELVRRMIGPSFEDRISVQELEEAVNKLD